MKVQNMKKTHISSIPSDSKLPDDKKPTSKKTRSKKLQPTDGISEFETDFSIENIEVEEKLENPDIKTKSDEKPLYIDNKTELLFGLSDERYDYENLNELMMELEDEKKLKEGLIYFEATFENDKASEYIPLEMRDNLEEEFRNKFEGELEPEMRTIYYTDDGKRDEFINEFKILIDRYFICTNKTFISKSRRRITSKDIADFRKRKG